MKAGSVVTSYYKPNGRVKKKECVSAWIYLQLSKGEGNFSQWTYTWTYYSEADTENIKPLLLPLGNSLAEARGQLPTNIYWLLTDEKLMMSTAVFLREAWWEWCFRKITLLKSHCGTPSKGPGKPEWGGFGCSKKAMKTVM